MDWTTQRFLSLHRFAIRVFCVAVCLSSFASAQDKIKTLILPGEAFLVEGRPAFILTPADVPSTGLRPWIMYAPTLAGLPDASEKWMHEQFLAAGIAVAGIDVGEGYGSPHSNRLISEFYREMTVNRGYALKPCLLGRSRGGLWSASWAGGHSDKVSGFAGIYPVFDLRSYPSISKAASAYEVDVEQLEKRLSEFNPIEQASTLAKARIPLFLIHGDEDKVVPLEQNSAEMASRYKAAGQESLVTLVVAKGQGHNYWEGFFRCQELIDFAIARAKSGTTKN